MLPATSPADSTPADHPRTRIRLPRLPFRGAGRHLAAAFGLLSVTALSIADAHAFSLTHPAEAAALPSALPLDERDTLPANCQIAEDESGIGEDEAPGLFVHAHFHAIRNDRGSIVITLYDDVPENFLAKGTKLKLVRGQAHEGETDICFRVPKAGVFAIAVYHDENDNWKLDKGFLSIPKEGVGFANMPKRRFSVPDHEDVAFTVGDGGTAVDVKLNYYGD